MRRAPLLAVFAAALLAVAAWWFSHHATEIRIPRTQLRAQLGERFPVERTAFLLLHWRLEGPALTLLPQRQRVAIGIDARLLGFRLENGRRDLGGRIDLESGLRYDEARGALFLSDPILTRLSIDGLPAAHAQRAAESLRGLLDEALTRQPLLVLKPAAPAPGASRPRLRELRVEADAVVVRLGK